MTNPTPSATPLTDDQVAAIRARLEATARENDAQRSRFVISLWPSTRATISVEEVAWLINSLRALLADRTALTRQLTDYALLREAVNASTTACAPDCTDEHAAHCPSHDPARWLIDQQREIAALTRRLEEADAKIADYVEREAACCPEDVGFAEYIGALTRRVEELTAELKALDVAAWDQATQLWNGLDDEGRKRILRENPQLAPAIARIPPPPTSP